jgi:putative membrane protein insertion efficiency factor
MRTRTAPGGSLRADAGAGAVGPGAGAGGPGAGGPGAGGPGPAGARRFEPAAGLVARAAQLVLLGYRRWVSPFLGPHCRFYPSCSAYAVEALAVHGAARGGYLVVRRILRCQPFHPGGVDPVPPRRGARSAEGREATPC